MDFGSTEMKAESFQKLAQQLNLQTIHVDYLVALSEINDQGETLILRLIGVFREIAPKILCDVMQAFDTADRFSAVKQLQIIESASQRIGAQRLATLCRVALHDVELGCGPHELDIDLECLADELARVNRELGAISMLLGGF